MLWAVVAYKIFAKFFYCEKFQYLVKWLKIKKKKHWVIAFELVGNTSSTVVYNLNQTSLSPSPFPTLLPHIFQPLIQHRLHQEIDYSLSLLSLLGCTKKRKKKDVHRPEGHFYLEYPITLRRRRLLLPLFPYCSRPSLFALCKRF